MPQSATLARYIQQSDDQLIASIEHNRNLLGKKLVMLGHHYQSDEIVALVDYTGDSLRLSQLAAQQQQASHIVFCGVHFMAESADILSAGHQRVYLPELQAGCPMADMADIGQVERCYEWLRRNHSRFDRIVPVCYVNSTAAIKAFCGREKGMCCTSSNCRRVFETIWDADPDAVILFLPDQHLGRNIAYRMGVNPDHMPLWDSQAAGGGLTAGQMATSRLLLWKGFCHVHVRFTVEQIEQARRENPAVKIMVHPESEFDVCNRADLLGSTDQIIKTISASEPGTCWRVGTEIKLVNRLARQMADRGVIVQSLNPDNSLCFSMARIGLPHLARVLDAIVAYESHGDATELVNQIAVPPAVKVPARVALERMLAVTA